MRLGSVVRIETWGGRFVSYRSLGVWVVQIKRGEERDRERERTWKVLSLQIGVVKIR